MYKLVPALATAIALGAPAVASAASHAAIIDCAGKAQQAPKSLTLFCGDGNDTLMGLHWKGWGGASATASATDEINLCNPSCVAGRDQPFPVSVTASDLKGGRYQKLTVTFTGKRPPKTARVEDWGLTVHGPETA
jgi:hypothetical protein